jgi:hypothetical protein
MINKNKIFFLAILSLILIFAVIFSINSKNFSILGFSTLTESEKESEIYSLTYEPTEPVALQQISFSVKVKNNQQKSNGYKLEFVVTKDGVVKSEDEFTFNLGAGGSKEILTEYTPGDINDFEIIARLYDFTTSKLLDFKTSKFNVISEIGPFDLEVSVPSKFVKANSILPILLSIANMGESGTDVNVDVVMKCVNQSNIKKSFFFYMHPKTLKNKVTPIETCNEEGQHEISASIRLFNRTWISSYNQFFINKTYTELHFTIPKAIDVNPGESKIFDLQINNTGNSTLHNLKLIISEIPTEWVQISPQTVPEIRPTELSVFLVNITTPKNTEAQEFVVGISAAADESLTRNEAIFKVNSLSFYTLTPGIGNIQTSLILQIFNKNLTNILLTILIIVVVIGVLKIGQNRMNRYGREEALRKLRKTIEKKE